MQNKSIAPNDEKTKDMGYAQKVFEAFRNITGLSYHEFFEDIPQLIPTHNRADFIPVELALPPDPKHNLSPKDFAHGLTICYGLLDAKDLGEDGARKYNKNVLLLMKKIMRPAPNPPKDTMAQKFVVAVDKKNDLTNGAAHPWDVRAPSAPTTKSKDNVAMRHKENRREESIAFVTKHMRAFHKDNTHEEAPPAPRM